MYRLYRYATLVAEGSFSEVVRAIGQVPDDKACEYVVQYANGPYRWVASGKEVDVPSLIALHESEEDGPRLGRADGADAIARMIGEHLHWPYCCHCYARYGDMTLEQYREMIAAGEEYARQFEAEYGDSVPPVV
jgi:hypothetical protein